MHLVHEWLFRRIINGKPHGTNPSISASGLKPNPQGAINITVIATLPGVGYKSKTLIVTTEKSETWEGIE